MTLVDRILIALQSGPRTGRRLAGQLDEIPSHIRGTCIELLEAGLIRTYRRGPTTRWYSARVRLRLTAAGGRRIAALEGAAAAPPVTEEGGSDSFSSRGGVLGNPMGAVFWAAGSGGFAPSQTQTPWGRP